MMRQERNNSSRLTSNATKAFPAQKRAPVLAKHSATGAAAAAAVTDLTDSF